MRPTVTGVIAALFLVPASFATAAQVDLLPGGGAILSGTTNAAEGGTLAGTVLNDNLIPFSLGGFVAGNVQNRVVEANIDGTLIFAPRIRDIVDLLPALEFSIIDGFTLSGYSGFQTLVEYRTDGLGDDGPDFATRSFDGDTLSFIFGAPALDLTEESYFLSINTDATQYALTGSMTIFGRADLGQPTQSVTITGLAVPIIPLPASGLLLFGALGGLAFLRKRG